MDAQQRGHVGPGRRPVARRAGARRGSRPSNHSPPPGGPPGPGRPGPREPAGATAPDARAGLGGLGLEELRVLRRDAQEQEADLSYLRRLLHGRMDILRAELDRRPMAGRGRRPRR